MSTTNMAGRLDCHSNIASDVVADFFLIHVDTNAGDLMSNLKLQKLCYYAQAWHLAVYDSPLFHHRIEAWAHGPVVPHLYHRFKSYKWNPIDPSDISCDPYSILSERQSDLLEEIWEKYGGLSAKGLERLAHSESPWLTAYGKTRSGDACNNEITLDAMKNFYREQLLKNGNYTKPAG